MSATGGSAIVTATPTALGTIVEEAFKLSSGLQIVPNIQIQ
jgi:hypothetical protein